MKARSAAGTSVVVVAAMAACACSTVTPTQTVAAEPDAPATRSTAPTQPTSVTRNATDTQSAQAVATTRTEAPQPVATALRERPHGAAGVAGAIEGLSDLDAMTFSCPREGLNAAAREAAKMPTQGHYQFAYFKIVNDSHHAMYEVHFKSNHHGEADLKYCVSVYCQQGWDSKKAKTSVQLMGSKPRPKNAGAVDPAHGADCDGKTTRTQASQSKHRMTK